ncbi:killer cell lectin-like receptor 3 isoform X2 [Arvicola amphibius]|uniref:killer cell lectin-like receptor 3 isoform X2 n=1 Tax=Arvicola amphibius TaxID=1047088 RepID=UPI0018E3F3E8|nr:killer cell lectin-like receptor 3 isoform X2 [Arvicola amphibius]
MTDEEITYATVRFHKSSSGLQKEGKSDETQGPRKAGHKECSVPWHLIAIPVGILCSILLVALAVLVTYSKPFKGHWFCCGIKCYYFIMDKKKWRGCNQTCQDCRLSLLKIDDDDELKFLQLQINQNNYWIGLSYNEKGKKWQWIDNGPSNLDSKIANFSRKTRRCAFLSRTRLENTKCESFYSCICEMRMDKDPDSPSSKS